jgi:hypothetical protein
MSEYRYKMVNGELIELSPAEIAEFERNAEIVEFERKNVAKTPPSVAPVVASVQPQGKPNAHSRARK